MTHTTPAVDSAASRRDVHSDIDELVAHGVAFLRSHFADELTNEAVATLIEHHAERPTPESLTPAPS